ncbi:MAG TPA: glycosyltransferase [Patescibacteria group bacterium]|nr:glycosyltransferase [Patescibacteria group bacterium]
MKIALVHDYIKEYGGAERVLETLHDMFPGAPVFTLVYCPEFLGPHKKRFQNWNIKTSFLQHIPYKEKFISIFRLVAPFVFPLFNFSGYDVVLVSATGAYSPNTIRKATAEQICYYHTPPRYLYGLATAREWKRNFIFKILAGIVTLWLRKIDKKSSENVDIAIANSETVKERIKKFYNKDAVVVYPPVGISKFAVGSSKFVVRSIATNNEQITHNYYLAGGRLARPKHYDLIIHAANALKIPLKIFGKGFAGYGEELQKIAGPTVEFLGEVTDEEKIALMANAKAFLMASVDEDFGITPVEAMGVGTPVIAYKSGGLRETVIDGKTGIFFDELTVASLENALKKFETLSLKSKDCVMQAEKFDTKHFKQGILSVVSKFAK